jgi:exocyst complex component 1
MLTIDPSIRQSGKEGIVEPSANLIDSQVSNMRAVQEKKEFYYQTSKEFVNRFNVQMTAKFETAVRDVQPSLSSRQLLASTDSKIDHIVREAYRTDLLQYAPFVLFEREIVHAQWEDLLITYRDSMKPLYRSELKDVIDAWKDDVKRSTGEEMENQFANQEREPEGLSRKLTTIKRSKTLAGGPRNVEKKPGGKIAGYKAFASALADWTQAILLEQNFMTDFFHLHSGENLDFPELIMNTSPSVQQPNNLADLRKYDPNRGLAKVVKETVDTIFSSSYSDMQQLVYHVLAQDPM